MPFVQRNVEPKFVCRSKSKTDPNKVSTPLPVRDNELQAITNLTLSNALRQLASIMAISNEIFTELNKELQSVSNRSSSISSRISVLGQKVGRLNAKLVTVPESDLITFVQIKNHFKQSTKVTTSLFTNDTRSETLQKLYDAAAKTPVPAIAEMDRLLGDPDRRSSDAFLCTPVLGQTRRRMRSNINMEIETSVPSAIDDLRKWTSSEAIGDVTVTPDCLARVDQLPLNLTTNTSSHSHHNYYYANNSNSNTIVQQQQPQPSCSNASVQDVTDDFIVVNSSSSNYRTNDTVNDVPLDHRLPSPEEQCQIIALKYPAEIVRVDITGRRFDRMSAARKSLLHFHGTSKITEAASPTLGDGEETVKRRSRSKKPRGKRRNTIAGTDQKEIEEAIIGDIELDVSPSDMADPSIVPRSKSSDILKKDSPTSIDSIKATTKLSHFNSLKQWGKNRLRLMNRSSGNNNSSGNDDRKDKVSDIDDFNVHEIYKNGGRKKNGGGGLDKDRKLSHERKPSYSSSEKSVAGTTKVNGLLTLPASINPVKLRESSAIRRRRLGLGQKDEPHSSSGNWSASSESGRTSIGSEITTTTQPKSSASSTSLNQHHPLSSGPPSSIISRRRFLNTSASSSVTSEGTATPDLQMYDMHDEGETSSVYSCDTEGYYTSFHVDSGLKTLKEEEPITPLHTSTALSSTTSFGSSGNQTVISPENEYELFGKGSTSTTTSSAGTVCTAVLASENERFIIGPAVPERKSSLTKLNRTSSNASSGTLERSYSSSTVGSTLERTGTIKRNGILVQKEVPGVVQQQVDGVTTTARIESPDSGNNTSSSPVESNSNSSPTQGVRSNSEYEYSESSDLECVDRIERIRVKTTINTSRIPSMCIITPTNSDDESSGEKENRKNLVNGDKKALIGGKVNEIKIVKTADVEVVTKKEPFKRSSLLPLNTMLGKLRGVLPNLKKSPNKESMLANNANDPIYDTAGEYVTIVDVQNNNGKKKPVQTSGVYYSNDVVKRNLATVLSGNLNEETEYVSLNELPCNMRCDSNPPPDSTTKTATREDAVEGGGSKKHPHNVVDKINTPPTAVGNGTPSDEEGLIRSRGARVTLDAQGKVVYSSDSLKRRKGAHTTFAPGLCVKEVETQATVALCSTTSNKLNNLESASAGSDEAIIPPSPLLSGGVSNRSQNTYIRPVTAQNKQPVQDLSKNVIIRQLESKTEASSTSSTTLANTVTSTTTTAASQMNGQVTTGALKGAYVNVQQNDVPANNFETGYQPLYHDTVDKGGNYAIRDTPTDRRYIPRLEPVDTNQFERGNNIYWTLQTRKPVRGSGLGTNVNAGVSKPLPANIEDLYSTPHKNRVKEPLKTTPVGFSTFFSPIKPTAMDMTPEKQDSQKISPIDPRSMSSGFKTSTPSKAEMHASPTRATLNEELRNKLRISEGTRSSGNSPVSSGRSTPRLEPQPGRGRHSWASNSVDVPQTCSDRLGTPKTSLMDFKKLLLAHGKSPIAPSTKLSAVELLKKSKQAPPPPTSSKPTPSNSSMNILDLSGSPKTFATRRMLRQGNYGNSSPSKTLGNPKHIARSGGWRYNNLRSEVMTTAIPEVNSEEDNSSPSTSASRSLSSRSSSPIKEHDEQPTSLPSVIEQKLNMRDNIFIKTEENNFMKHELQQKSAIANSLTSRAQLQAQRAQFLFNNNVYDNKTQPQSSPPTHFNRNGGLVSTDSNKYFNSLPRNCQITPVSTPSPTSGSTVPRTQSPNSGPALETAL